MSVAQLVDLGIYVLLSSSHHLYRQILAQDLINLPVFLGVTRSGFFRCRHYLHTLPQHLQLHKPLASSLKTSLFFRIYHQRRNSRAYVMLGVYETQFLLQASSPPSHLHASQFDCAYSRTDPLKTNAKHVYSNAHWLQINTEMEKQALFMA